MVGWRVEIVYVAATYIFLVCVESESRLNTDCQNDTLANATRNIKYIRSATLGSRHLAHRSKVMKKPMYLSVAVIIFGTHALVDNVHLPWPSPNHYRTFQPRRGSSTQWHDATTTSTIMNLWPHGCRAEGYTDNCGWSRMFFDKRPCSLMSPWTSIRIC